MAAVSPPIAVPCACKRPRSERILAVANSGRTGRKDLQACLQRRVWRSCRDLAATLEEGTGYIVVGRGDCTADQLLRRGACSVVSVVSVPTISTNGSHAAGGAERSAARAQHVMTCAGRSWRCSSSGLEVTCSWGTRNCSRGALFALRSSRCTRGGASRRTSGSRPCSALCPPFRTRST